MPTEAYSSPVLFQANAARKWLHNQHETWFSLANLGSYNQRVINQLLGVAELLCPSVHFFPFLLRSSYASAGFSTLYADGAPYCTMSEADPYAYAPAQAEQEIVRDMLAFVREWQAIPLQTASTLLAICTRTLNEVASRYAAEGVEPVERDKYDQIVWGPTSHAATCLGITEESSTFWDAVDLLERSIKAYAKDKDLSAALQG